MTLVTAVVLWPAYSIGLPTTITQGIASVSATPLCAGELEYAR